MIKYKIMKELNRKKGMMQVKIISSGMKRDLLKGIIEICPNF